VWELGVRHYDTAPLYGSGDAEVWLGEFLARVGAGATVTTKCGLLPASTRRVHAVRAIARIVRRCCGPLASFPATLLRGLGSRSPQERVPRSAAEYRAIAADMEASLHASLSKLKRECVDVFAIHEPDPGILAVDELLTGLVRVKEAGKARAVAAAGYFREIFPIATAATQPFDLFQFEHDASGAHISRWREAELPPPILFGALSNTRRTEREGTAHREQYLSAKLKAALDANPGGLVLFSTTKVAHAEEILASLS
jgi:aryl-alcohol dehydrogenase-like predicted oxidoreductase